MPDPEKTPDCDLRRRELFRFPPGVNQLDYFRLSCLSEAVERASFLNAALKYASDLRPHRPLEETDTLHY